METIKEEKKADLEQLLNSLIEKGWKPFGEDRITKINRCEQYAGHWNWGCWSEKSSYWRWKCTRQLVSKESGLWQFCEESKMLIGFSPRTRTKNAHENYGSILGDIEYWGSDYEYRLIEASLKDESELEDFLLQNIKVEGKND